MGTNRPCDILESMNWGQAQEAGPTATDIENVQLDSMNLTFRIPLVGTSPILINMYECIICCSIVSSSTKVQMKQKK